MTTCLERVVHAAYRAFVNIYNCASVRAYVRVCASLPSGVGFYCTSS